MTQKKRPDRNSPEWMNYPGEVLRNSFTREGMMVAFPTCFPGATIPIVHDESHITALDITPGGIVHGGTSGRQTHLFAANFHGHSGMVFDLGTPQGATSCVAVCCGTNRFLAFVNGPRGGRAVASKLQTIDSDLIQEWGIEVPVLDDVGECVAGEPVVHAVADASRQFVIGVTKNHLFTTEIESPKTRVVGEVSGSGRIAVASSGAVFGSDGGGRVWRFDPKSGSLERGAVALPRGDWNGPMFWAKDGRAGLLYTADASGRFFAFDEKRGFSAPLGSLPLAPAGPMAVTFDGRVFGFCGDEMANMFCYDPARREVSNLGVAVSVIERRRYGYVFGDAVTGRDGEIFFGEDDNGGHLWLYFPRIVPAQV